MMITALNGIKPRYVINLLLHPHLPDSCFVCNRSCLMQGCHFLPLQYEQDIANLDILRTHKHNQTYRQVGGISKMLVHAS